MEKIKYVVWDWNGTLVDDVDCAVDTMNVLLSEHRLREPLSQREYKEHFCFPVRDYYQKLGFDVESPDFSKVAERFLEVYDEKHESCSLHEGVAEVMDRLAKKGIRQIILSASEKNNLLRQVAGFQLDEQVEEVLGIDDIYAASKVYLAKNWIEKNGIDPKEILFIGDTVHDCEVAVRNGANCLLIAKGHQNREILEKTGKTILSSHREIIPYMESF